MENNQFRCNVCGRFVSLQDIVDGVAQHHLKYPGADPCVTEETETTCKNCLAGYNQFNGKLNEV